MIKLLFDQNISFRILKKLDEPFANSSQVRLEGLENASDLEIWNYAKKHSFTIITFDTDFYDISLIHKAPPKIIWLRIGNMTTTKLVECLRLNSDLIVDFICDANYSEIDCLEIDDWH